MASHIQLIERPAPIAKRGFWGKPEEEWTTVEILAASLVGVALMWAAAVFALGVLPAMLGGN